MSQDSLLDTQTGNHHFGHSLQLNPLGKHPMHLIRCGMLHEASNESDQRVSTQQANDRQHHKRDVMKQKKFHLMNHTQRMPHSFRVSYSCIPCAAMLKTKPQILVFVIFINNEAIIKY